MDPAERDTFQHCVISRRPDGSLWELGRGAMGVTYRALDSNLHAPVALKVIGAALLPDARARARFLREARSAAQLRHSNVATVYHLGQEDDCVFYTMEWIDGETTEALVRRAGPLDAPTALRIAQQTARALQAAHARNLLHRDLKPSNLMVVQEGGDLLVKVIDFGLVKPLEGSDDPGDAGASLSGGLFIGTPLYASPELCTQSETLDGRADLYSLGAVLWFLLTGEPPFKGSARSVIAQHITKPLPLDALRGQPPEVTALLADLLAKEPSQRPPDANAVRQRIADLLAPGLGAPAPAAREPAAPADGAPAVFSLETFMNRRPVRLTRPEARLLLFPLAALADHALFENRRPDLSPGELRVRFLEPGAGPEAPVTAWPRFALETRDLPPVSAGADPSGETLRAVAGLTQRLLGAGALTFLPPETAAALTAALSARNPPAYPSASAFAIAFIATWQRGAPEESAHPTSAPIFPPAAADARAAETLLETGEPPPPPLAPPSAKRLGCLPALVVLAAVGLCFALAPARGFLRKLSPPCPPRLSLALPSSVAG